MEETSNDSSEANPQMSDTKLAQSAVEFTQQAEKLSYQKPSGESSDSVAIEARFVTPQDPVIITSDGNRLPGVPLEEAYKLNILREELHDDPTVVEIKDGYQTKERLASTREGAEKENVAQLPTKHNGSPMQRTAEGSLRRAMPPSHTNPLFPPLPLYGPATFFRDIQCAAFRVSSFFLSLAFLAVIVLGALFTSIPPSFRWVFYKLTFRNPDKKRPFYEEERRRLRMRAEAEVAWKRNKSHERIQADNEGTATEYIPTEGGKDPIICDVGYYARRVGLDVEEFKVQTEDGFIIDLWHVFDPKEHTKLDDMDRDQQGPEVFSRPVKPAKSRNGKPKFPVLLMHGLLQSAGAYCVNDDDSLAFFLCKSGYDVWLGNNRCGFKPKHVLLKYSDPRMWCWNIRQMGVFDLPALTSRVLYETGFDKIGLVCHSQGTTQTFVALAKEQRPELGEKLTVFCALAPAAYAGPLIGKMYFKFMRVISPSLFRLMFGIHSFIPFMMEMHSLLPGTVYGWLGYKVFSFLFDWTDHRWDRGLRDRMFQFAPVYVSAESMRWWLGRECFARHKCILSTKEIVKQEEKEDELDGCSPLTDNKAGSSGPLVNQEKAPEYKRKARGATAWYNEQAPPFAMWVAGSDDLVDGKKLLRRFERGREPHVRVIHAKVIPEYEHLDVIWAMDAVDQVFKEVREVLWKTCSVRDLCRVPQGCENVEAWTAEDTGDTVLEDDREDQTSSSDDTE
jgi:pimeloyl-ACP methyl ester carboxylesterase